MVCVGPVYASGQRCTKSPNRAGLIDRRPLCVRYLKSSWATTGSVSPFFGCSSFSSFRTSCESVLSWHVVGCVSFVVSGVGVLFLPRRPGTVWCLVPDVCPVVCLYFVRTGSNLRFQSLELILFLLRTLIWLDDLFHHQSVVWGCR